MKLKRALWFKRTAARRKSPERTPDDMESQRGLLKRIAAGIALNKMPPR